MKRNNDKQEKPIPEPKAWTSRHQITPELRRNVHIEYYEAGHTMYVHPGSMGKFSEHLRTFIDENSN